MTIDEGPSFWVRIPARSVRHILRHTLLIATGLILVGRLEEITRCSLSQPKTLLWLKVHPFSQLQRNVSQLLAGRGRWAWCMAACQNHFEPAQYL